MISPFSIKVNGMVSSGWFVSTKLEKSLKKERRKDCRLKMDSYGDITKRFAYLLKRQNGTVNGQLHYIQQIAKYIYSTRVERLFLITKMSRMSLFKFYSNHFEYFQGVKRYTAQKWQQQQSYILASSTKKLRKINF